MILIIASVPVAAARTPADTRLGIHVGADGMSCTADWTAILAALVAHYNANEREKGRAELVEGGASALFTFAQTGNSHHVVARKTRLTAAEVQVEGEKLMSLVTSSEDVKTAAPRTSNFTPPYKMWPKELEALRKNAQCVDTLCSTMPIPLATLRRN